MALQVEECRRLLKPRNIFELLPRQVFAELILGFYYGFSRDVVLLWAEYDQIQDKWIVDVKNRLEPHPPVGGERPPEFSIFCWELRNKIGATHCLDYDCKTAQEYIDGIRTKPRPYKCWAKLIELAYPLKYGGEVRAVLLAGGQIVPTEEAEKDTFQQAILNLPDGPNLWQHLQPFLQQEIDRQTQKGVGTSLEETRKRLEDIGKGLQGVIDRLYETSLDRAIHFVQEDLQAIFSKADLSNRRIWWDGIKGLFDDFCKVTGLEQILVFQRRYSNYEPAGGYLAEDRNQKRLEVREVITNIPKGQLYKVTTDDISNLTSFGLAKGSKCRSYRTEQRLEKIVLSTIMFIPGDVPEPYNRFVEDFCRIAAGYMDIASMVFMVQEAKSKYENQVGSIAHSARNPLQSIFLELGAFSKIPLVQNDSALLRRLQDVENRIDDAKRDINILLREIGEEFVDINTVKLLRRVLQNHLPQAREKHCWFTEKGDWSKELIVQGSEIRLLMAFADLVDNAIKYSWDSHDIRIGLDIFDNDHLEVSISNFGLGIAPEKLEGTRLFKIRGEISDFKRPVRTGTGWGLPSAIDTIERHGGWLEIESRPADEGYRAPNEKYHRYITEVLVYLPLRDKK